jgi:hypothetical protein
LKGGALCLSNSGSATATIVDTLFQNNQAIYGGKVIYIFPSASLTIINPNPSSQTDAIGGTPSKLITTCPTSTDICAQYNLPGHVCSVPDPQTTPYNSLTCTPDTTSPAISNIVATTSTNCLNDNNNVYHLNKCKATTAGISITITGVYFDQTQTDSYTNKVTINDIDCPHTNSWTNTQISCIPADATQVGKDLVVKVYTKNGKFTYQQPDPKFLSFLPPTITSIAPATGTPEGGTAVTIDGDNFGPASVAAVVLLMGDMPFTSVVHVNGNTLTAITPALVGTNNGENLQVSLHVVLQDVT